MIHGGEIEWGGWYRCLIQEHRESYRHSGENLTTLGRALFILPRRRHARP